MPGQQSAWHTVRSAALWLFHRPLVLEVGGEKSSATAYVVGSDVVNGEHPQVVVADFDFADFGLSAP